MRERIRSGYMNDFELMVPILVVVFRFEVEEVEEGLEEWNKSMTVIRCSSFGDLVK